jgi:hypothetical protein
MALAPVLGLAAELEVICGDLSAEVTAEVEARARASLLAESADTAIRVRCEAETVTVLALASGRSETVELVLTRDQPVDAILRAVERALQALRDETQSTATFPAEQASGPPADIPSAALSPSPAAPAPSAARPTPPSAKPQARARKYSLAARVSAGLLAELWSHLFVYGGRAGAELGLAPWSLGLAVGCVTSTEQEAAFVATEWHAIAFGSFEATALAGFRGSVGLGGSLLVATPSEGLVAPNGSTEPGLFAYFAISRPFRFGRVALVPALHLRTFFARREIMLDGLPALELPLLSPALFLGGSFEFSRPVSK